MDIQNDIEKLRSQNLFINPTNDVENLDQLRIKYDKNKSFLETQLEEFLRVKKEINNQLNSHFLQSALLVDQKL